MYIQLFIDGRLKKNWFVDDFPDVSLSHFNHLERGKYIAGLVQQCKIDAGHMIYECQHYEMYVVIESLNTVV